MRRKLLGVCVLGAVFAAAAGAPAGPAPASGEAMERARAHWREEGLRWYRADPPQMERAKAAFHEAAERGDARSWFALGRIAEDEGDEESARRFYEKASQGGFAPADHNLALLARKRGDLEGYVRWLRRAAIRGVAESQRDLGVLYHLGRDGVERDLVEAAFWYERAWEAAGDGRAAYARGLVAEERGEPPEVARAWMERAARLGVPQAMARYGFYLGAGLGGSKDLAEARRWLLKAREASTDPYEQKRLAEWLAAVDAEVMAAAGELVRPESLGTGVAVSPRGWIVTAAANVRDLRGRTLRVWIPPGTYVEAALEAVDEETGLALLRAAVATPKYVPLSEEAVELGAKVALVGHRQAFRSTLGEVFEVEVERRATVRGRAEYVLKTKLPSHLFGSALVGERGLVGVLVPWGRGVRIPTRMRAVAAETIRALWAERWAGAAEGEPVVDPVGRARSAVVRIMAESPRFRQAAAPDGAEAGQGG